MSFFDRLFSQKVDEIDHMRAEVAVGLEFKNWIDGPCGQYIIGRAEQYELLTLRKLAETPAHHADEIALLQAEAKAPALLLQWIEEAMFAGEQANFQLMELEE